jgi:catechol 2,3-dioxygenase-like lactoylglutathione lyase family enzyme
MNTNVGKAVPFLRVTDMASSLHFYVDGLGFSIARQWIPESDEHYPSDGKIRWCWLELGDAAIMLQEFAPQSRPKATLGSGVSISFTCQDALVMFRDFKSRGVDCRIRPYVGNGLWVVPLADPDGYLIEFASPTDALEESELLDSP